MDLDNTSITIALIVAAILLYLCFCDSRSGSYPINNSGSLASQNGVVFEDDEDDDEIVDNETQEGEEGESEAEAESESEGEYSEDSGESHVEKLRMKMLGKNHTQRDDGSYKNISYRNGTRGGRSDTTLDQFFTSNAPQEAHANNNFVGMSNEDNLAQYIPGTEKKKDDIFNSRELLPKETNKDWFEVHHNVKVKNAHLINVYRPIGANTVSGTLRNPSYDFRGDVSNPRYIVGPWNQSTIDPDVNNRGLCRA